jgi:hypothetical protein
MAIIMAAQLSLKRNSVSWFKDDACPTMNPLMPKHTVDQKTITAGDSVGQLCAFSVVEARILPSPR